MLLMIELNMFPTPVPKKDRATMTASPISRIKNAYSTRP